MLMSIPLFHYVPSATNGYLSSLQLETIKNNVTMNILIQTISWAEGCIFLEYLPKNEMFGIYSLYRNICAYIIFIHANNLHTHIYTQTYTHSVLLDTAILFSKYQILDNSISRQIFIYFTHFNFFIFKTRYKTKENSFSRQLWNCSVS